MATAVMIYDTLKLAEQLEHEAGFDAARAKSMARILAENTGGNLATREDLLLTQGELKTEIQAVRNDLQGVRSELKGEIQGLRVEMQDVRGDIRVLYWMIGTTLAGVAAILSIAIGIGLHAIHLQ